MEKRQTFRLVILSLLVVIAIFVLAFISSSALDNYCKANAITFGTLGYSLDERGPCKHFYSFYDEAPNILLWPSFLSTNIIDFFAQNLFLTRNLNVLIWLLGAFIGLFVVLKSRGSADFVKKILICIIFTYLIFLGVFITLENTAGLQIYSWEKRCIPLNKTIIEQSFSSCTARNYIIYDGHDVVSDPRVQECRRGYGIDADEIFYDIAAGDIETKMAMDALMVGCLCKSVKNDSLIENFLAQNEFRKHFGRYLGPRVYEPEEACK